MAPTIDLTSGTPGDPDCPGPEPGGHPGQAGDCGAQDPPRAGAAAVAASLALMFGLDGRTALVTGASSGIGRAMAEALARAGAAVVLLGRRKEALAETGHVIAAHGGRYGCVIADLADRRQLAAAAERGAAFFGEPDIVVNAAGVSIRPPLESLTVPDWDITLAVNLTAPFLLGQRFGPPMARRGWGRIINVGSQQAFRAFGNSGGYGPAKAGLVALTRSQAEAWSRCGVCCNAVIPGLVRTPMTEAIFANPARAEPLAARSLGGRHGLPDDFRGVAVFLAGPASAHVTGQAIFVDGGFASG